MTRACRAYNGHLRHSLARSNRRSAPRPMASKPWLSGAFIGEFADCYIDDTELEGNDPRAALLELAAVVRSVAGELRASREIAMDTASHLEFAAGFPSGPNPVERIRSFKTKLEAMVPDEYLMVPAGAFRSRARDMQPTLTTCCGFQDGRRLTEVMPSCSTSTGDLRSASM